MIDTASSSAVGREAMSNGNGLNPSSSSGSSQQVNGKSIAQILNLPTAQSIHDNRFSLNIPIASSLEFIEIFSQELPQIPPSTLLPILEEEKASLAVYNSCASLYSLYNLRHARQVMEAGLKLAESTQQDDADVVRLHASMGILYTMCSCVSEDPNGADADELRANATHHVQFASKINIFHPIVHISKAIIPLTNSTPDYSSAVFWLSTVQKEVGKYVLCAILGIGCAMYHQQNYHNAMKQFESAARLYGGGRSHPVVFSGILTLYSLTLAKLGQVDRAIYGFSRAIHYHKENVVALVSKSVLEMRGIGMDILSSTDEQNQVNRILQTLSLANILDTSNASAQILLSEFYFQKWNALERISVKEVNGKEIVCDDGGDLSRNLSKGDHIRIGNDFDTIVASVNDELNTVQLADVCTISKYELQASSKIFVYKKDYDRVEDLAKSAYQSTKNAALQGEALTVLAKALHCRRDFTGMKKCLLKALDLSGKANPNRVALWGLAQCFVKEKKYNKAINHLQNLSKHQPNSPEPHALIALILANQNFVGDRAKILNLLKKATELSQQDPEYVLLEASILQRAKEFKLSLKLYKKVIDRKEFDANMYMNVGVVCLELGLLEESMQYFKRAASKFKESKDIEYVEGADLTEPNNLELFKDDDDRFWVHSTLTLNVARLQESAQRFRAAAELYKIILKKHPSYVNSYLRLACLSRDLGDLNACAQWLSCAIKVEPKNNSVLTLVGNLHTSLLDWAPAQQIFNNLSSAGDATATYSQLSLGNIYFSNLTAGSKYSKHLQHAADFCRRILIKDPSNLYAALGLGTVLAEKGDLIRAKEAFNIVRSSSNDNIPDVLINLGHIYLAQQRHAESLQMYQAYLDRKDKSNKDSSDVNNVLLYVAYAYYDWGRTLEGYNNTRSAPANDHYDKAMEFLNAALGDASDPEVTPKSSQQYMLRYNLCMTKLAAANCTLQKLSRHIKRTSTEVRRALNHLIESMTFVEGLMKAKNETKKVPVGRSILVNFISQCRTNIESAKSHLNEELKKEHDAEQLRDLQRKQTELQIQKQEHFKALQIEAEIKKQEEMDSRAKAKMEKVQSLVSNWGQQAEIDAQKKAKKGKKGSMPEFIDGDEVVPVVDKDLFADSDSDDNDDNEKNSSKGLEIEEALDDNEKKDSGKVMNENELFGESSDEELVPESNTSKRPASDEMDDSNNSKKARRVIGEE